MFLQADPGWLGAGGVGVVEIRAQEGNRRWFRAPEVRSALSLLWLAGVLAAHLLGCSHGHKNPSEMTNALQSFGKIGSSCGSSLSRLKGPIIGNTRPGTG